MNLIESFLYLNSSSDSSIKFLMNCTWNGNIPAAVSLEAPASSVADSFRGAIATAPLGKGSILCFMLSNMKLWAVDSEKMKKL